MTVRKVLDVVTDDVLICLTNNENENEYLRFINGEIKFLDIKPYLNFKVVSIRPLPGNEIRIEYKKESK